MNEYIPIIKFYIITYPTGRWHSYKECYDYYYNQHKLFYEEHKELLSDNIIETNARHDADSDWNKNIIGEIKMVQIDITRIDDHIKEVENNIKCEDKHDNEHLHPHHSNNNGHHMLNTALMSSLFHR